MSILHLPFSKVGALWAQAEAHLWQPTHLSVTTLGLPWLCCSILPLLEPEPIPIFFNAPPKPVASWPLKCVREMKISASIMALPILAFFTYSPPLTGTSISSSPLRPSAIITCAPVVRGPKPLRVAVSRWSMAFFLDPT